MANLAAVGPKAATETQERPRVGIMIAKAAKRAERTAKVHGEVRCKKRPRRSFTAGVSLQSDAYAIRPKRNTCELLFDFVDGLL